MGGKSTEMSLDMSTTTSFALAPKTISDFLDEASMIPDFPGKLTKINDYIRALEAELRKIDAFKCELPLCKHLLKDAIDGMKEEIMQCKRTKIVPVMEEEGFLPLKSNFEEEEGLKKSTDDRDKKNWMSTAQLWSTTVHYDSDIKKYNSFLDPKFTNGNNNNMEEGSANEPERTTHQLCNLRNRVGAYLPFKKQLHRGMNGGNKIAPFRGPPITEAPGLVNLSLKAGGGRISCGSSESNALQLISRKQRRCWLPELHRRFVSALQQLGGAEIATPKQIRELMRVDCLTNDEVKSHLQKYRFHVRKLSASSTSAPSNGFWKNISSANGGVLKAHTVQSGSPEGPLHLALSSKGVSIACGDSIGVEDEQEEKSESHSLKDQRLNKAAEYHVQPRSP